MRDARLEKLARQLMHYSVGIQKGEKVLIECTAVPPELAGMLVEEAYAAGAQPFVQLNDPHLQRAQLMQITDAQLEEMAAHDAARMRAMDAYIGIRGGDNPYETRDVPTAQMRRYAEKYTQPVHLDVRINQTRWVVLRYPNASMAQKAMMSTPAFEDYYFSVCNLDYAKMSRAMDALVTRMSRTDQVRITGPDTDLTFSIRGIPTVKCDGHLNIPDGEVYTAPVKESVNGTLRINAPSLHEGIAFSDIALTFENGRIVRATSNNTERQNAILDSDDGARYIGEFAIGVNPHIHDAMMDTLFDEKIAGSFHFTPGNSYDNADNGNKSSIHWDLVCIQTPEYGGGRIYFDGELIREDGRFITEDLRGLNPENLH